MDNIQKTVKIPLFLDKQIPATNRGTRLFFQLKTINSRLDKLHLANQLYDQCYNDMPIKTLKNQNKNAKSSQRIALDMNKIFNRLTNSIGIKKDYSKSKYTEITKFQNNDFRNYMQSPDPGLFISELRPSYRNDSTLQTEAKDIKMSVIDEEMGKHPTDFLPKIQKTFRPTHRSCNLSKDSFNTRVKHFSPVHFNHKFYNDLQRNNHNTISITELKPNILSADFNQPERILKRYEIYDYIASKRKIFKP